MLYVQTNSAVIHRECKAVRTCSLWRRACWHVACIWSSPVPVLQCFCYGLCSRLLASLPLPLHALNLTAYLCLCQACRACTAHTCRHKHKHTKIAALV